MNIGFEAKRAFYNGTGLGHYSRTLISSLATYFSEHEYYLFTPKNTELFNTTTFHNIHTITPISFPSNLLTSFWRSSWVKKDLKKLNIQLYHGLSHEIPLGMKTTNIPSVVTMHDLIFERYPEQYKPIDVKIYRKKFQHACKYADKVIAISKQTKQDLVQFYKVPEQKIDICYQSCNPAFAQKVSEEEKQNIKKLYNLPDEYFLYVGSIVERKNLLQICKGIHLLKDTLQIPLVVIGEGGDYKKIVKEYINTHQLQDKIIFLSEKYHHPTFKTAQDFPAIYQQAVCMIYPSFFEGFGIPVLEALWSNIPVITSNASCMPETGGNAAYYVNPNSEKEMADALYNVYTDISLRKSMVEKGIVHAQQFTQQKCAATVMDVYKKLI
ncbi:MAG: glycosyltransferase family 4 protein [Chitinophagaceae bacterium]|nr:glycosyltransferase family 4 protein [Chitinophagaceae bacterium]MCW5905818.1 glycosyltransferase family 4 protein [Chitinophagaceae bacterium]